MRKVLLHLSLAIFLMGCATGGKLATYEPKSTAEAEIKKSFMDFEDAYNKRDLDRCLSHVHKDIKYEQTGGSWASRENMPQVFESAWRLGTRIRYAAPEIALDGDEAVVKIPTR